MIRKIIYEYNPGWDSEQTEIPNPCYENEELFKRIIKIKRLNEGGELKENLNKNLSNDNSSVIIIKKLI